MKRKRKKKNGEEDEAEREWVRGGREGGKEDTYDFPTQNASLQNTACRAWDLSMEYG